MRFRSEPIMFKRDSVALHQIRVKYLHQAIVNPLHSNPIEVIYGIVDHGDFNADYGDVSPMDFQEAFNFWIFGYSRKKYHPGYAEFFAGEHDWIEIFTEYGDVPTHHKTAMSSDEKRALENAELEEIEKITDSCISSSNFDLERTLLDTVLKETLEAQHISYLDKFDGFMSCAHELLVGNSTFENPFKRYCDELEQFKRGKYPNLLPLFDTKYPVYDVEGLTKGRGNAFNDAYQLWIEVDKVAQFRFDNYFFSVEL